MMMKSWILPMAGAMAMALAACQSEQDVPVPNDPQAQEWNDSIKTAYPDWQPTAEAPKGNDEFESMFVKAEVPAEPVKEIEPVKKAAVEAEPVDEAEKAKYPILYAPVPDKVRLDVTAGNDLLINGVVFPEDIVTKYLKRMVKSHGQESAVIIRADAKAHAEKLNKLLDICKAEKVGKVSFTVVTDSKTAGKTAAKKTVKPVRMVLDSEKPASSYVVKAGDTLGSIAQKYYKNAAYWTFIYNANKAVIKNPNRLTLKMKLQIPALKAAGGVAK